MADSPLPCSHVRVCALCRAACQAHSTSSGLPQRHARFAAHGHAFAVPSSGVSLVSAAGAFSRAASGASTASEPSSPHSKVTTAPPSGTWASQRKSHLQQAPVGCVACDVLGGRQARQAKAGGVHTTGMHLADLHGGLPAFTHTANPACSSGHTEQSPRVQTWKMRLLPPSHSTCSPEAFTHCDIRISSAPRSRARQDPHIVGKPSEDLRPHLELGRASRQAHIQAPHVALAPGHGRGMAQVPCAKSGVCANDLVHVAERHLHNERSVPSLLMQEADGLPAGRAACARSAQLLPRTPRLILNWTLPATHRRVWRRVPQLCAGACADSAPAAPR